jgi:hypothetical protein
MPYDLFLGVPVHRAPAVVAESGMIVDGWIPVDPGPCRHGIRVYPPPGTSPASEHPRPRSSPKGEDIEGPSADLVADKTAFGSERSRRWFGQTWHATQPEPPPA